MADMDKGLYSKYRVTKANGTPLDGDCFVLRPDRDPAAVKALLAYAASTPNEELSSDIRIWLASIGADMSVPDEIAALRAEVDQLREAAKPITGETSDGYHTFNELYHHRAILFSVICNDRSELAWKAKKHHDGTMYDGMFIVGIETPEGQATYHYDIDPYWDMFCVKEMDAAPEWDGHTPAQAIERIGKLRFLSEWEEAYAVQSGVNRRLEAEVERFKADIEAGRMVRFEEGEPYWYCPHCREEVGAYSVTYGELHDRCGHPVEWIKPVKRAALEGGQQ